MMNEEPPYGTIAWFFYEIDEKQKQLSFLLSEVDEKIAKIRESELILIVPSTIVFGILYFKTKKENHDE